MQGIGMGQAAAGVHFRYKKKTGVAFAQLVAGIFYVGLGVILLGCFQHSRIFNYCLFVFSAAACFLLFAQRKVKYCANVFLGYCAAMLIFGLANYLTVKETTLSYIGMYLTYAILAYLLIHYDTSENYTLLLYYILAVFFYGKFLQGVDPNQVFQHISRNGISAYLLFFICLYYIQCEKNGKKKNVMHLLAGLPIVVWAVGRSGILAFGILTAGLFYEAFTEKRTSAAKKLAFVLAGMVAVVFLSCRFRIYIQIVASNFYQFGFTSPREGINQKYLLDALGHIQYFFFGVPIHQDPYYSYFNYNLHNSFLTFHKNLGLVPLLFFCLLLADAVLRYIRKKKVLYVTVILALGVRSFTDTLAFYGTFDILWLYLVFLNTVRKDGSS